jgi:hypothetical protein
MKITNDNQPIQGFPADKTTESPDASPADFNSILQGTLDTSAGADGGPQPPAVVETVVPTQLEHLQATVKLSTVERIENVLDLLDEYGRRLADPNTTLKEIHPLVNSLESQSQQLKPVLNFMADDDQLKQILNETLVTSSLEIFKYNKGDYI